VRVRGAAREGYTAYPDSVGGRQCRSIAASIEQPEYSLQGMEADSLRQQSLQVTYKNLDRLYFRAYSIDLAQQIASSKDYNLLPEGEELEAADYYAKLYEKMDMLEMDRSFTSRAVNEGFSGGEKKRNEILQLAMLEPKYAVLDETDSGLDIDALKVVANGVNSLRGPDLGVLLITHYQRLLDYIIPDHVHVMVQGRIVRSGDKELALELEEKGYDWVRDHAPEAALA
jgi:FeS assembly ATPase SufC